MVYMPKRLIQNFVHKLRISYKAYPLLYLLVLILLVLCYTNYVPGHFLSGWDTLHPEFNYRIYWARILGGVWQEHQSLGAVATQAHASEIPRILILMIMDIFLRTDQIRIFYAFLMMILGPVGMYFFVRNIVMSDSSQSAKELGGFASGLFYILNLGILQQFYVPLEMFMTHFGFLGWVFYFSGRYLNNRKLFDKTNLAIFSLITFLTSSQAHTSTLFYAFIVCYTGFLFLVVIFGFFKSRSSVSTQVSSKNSFYQSPRLTAFYKATILMSITLVVNLYWFMPNLYFALKHGSEVQESKIHQLFSQEAFLQNKEFGTLEDVSVLRNFLFNWGEHTGNAQFGDLLDEWKLYYTNDYIYSLGYVFFGLLCAGVFIALLRRNFYASAVLGVFLFGLFFLFNINPPLGWLFIFLQDNVPLFKEAFRFPFTKFSIVLVFSYAVFFGYFWGSLLELFSKINKRKIESFTSIFLTSLVTISLIIYMLPAFYGSFISPSMKVKIPDRYFEMFSYFDNQYDYGRVANFPIHTFWGWVYHDWNATNRLGYQGAGFLWFGIKQPLLDREFDRWNLTNENYYYEMSNAIYSEDISKLELVLNKYKVRWLLLDESVLVISADDKQLFYEKIRELFEESPHIQLEEDFGAGLYVYRYEPPQPFSQKELITDFVYVSDSLFKEYEDSILKSVGTYVNDFNTDTNDEIFPFIGITDSFENINTSMVDSTKYEITLSPSQNSVASVETNTFYSEFEVLAEYSPESLVLTINDVLSDAPSQRLDFLLPQEFVFDPNAEYVLNIDKNLFILDLSNNAPQLLGTAWIDLSSAFNVSLYISEQYDIAPIFYTSTLETCGIVGIKASYALKRYEDGFGLFGKNVNACVTTALANLFPPNQKYADFVGLNVEYEDLGARSDICLLDSISGLCLNPPGVTDSNIYSFIELTNINNYYVRFFADGQNSGNTQVGVRYKNVFAVFPKLLASQDFNFSASLPEVVSYENTFIFEKDISFSKNVKDFVMFPRSCSGNTSIESSAVTREDSYIRYVSEDDSICDSIQMPHLSHTSGYILEIVSRNVEGIPLRLCLTNEYSKRCDIYVSLGDHSDFKSDFFVIPPTDEKYGYTLNFSNIHFGESINVSDLAYIGIAQIPYDTLRSAHSAPRISSDETLIVFNQAYEPGWIAFCGTKLCSAKHVMVNNWANGWVFEQPIQPQEVTPLFWPQILENIGILLLIVVTIKFIM